MLKTLLQNQKFLSRITDFYGDGGGEILDIFIFGSVVRGKKKPADIDILILFKEKENIEAAYELRKILEKTVDLKIQITTRTYKNLFDAGFLPREYILSEAYSINLKKNFSKAFGYSPYTLFTYKLAGLTPTKRTLFHYALFGRGKSGGMLKDLEGLKISTYVIIPIENSDKFVEFLNNWKLDFKKTPVLIPERIIKYKEI